MCVFVRIYVYIYIYIYVCRLSHTAKACMGFVYSKASDPNTMLYQSWRSLEIQAREEAAQWKGLDCRDFMFLYTERLMLGTETLTKKKWLDL